MITAKKVQGDEVAAEGFAQSNSVPHMLIESDEADWTISVKTKDGRLLTFSFLDTGKPGGCVDVHWANNPMTVKGANKDDRPVQPVVLFSKNRTFWHCANNVDDPVTLLTLVMDGSFDDKLSEAK